LGKFNELTDLQSAPLRYKLLLTQQRVKEAVEKFGVENCPVSFSGGKDSTVLLHIVRSMYPDAPAIFVNTGTEFPEIVEFVKSMPNVEQLRPHMSFKQVIEKYGYPVVSKNVSKMIYEIRNTKSLKLLHIRLHGNRRGFESLAKKWRYLIAAPFKISDLCCDKLKKRPIRVYNKRSDRFCNFVGTMASESFQRKVSWCRFGCNAFERKAPQSRPLSLWLEQDIWAYIREHNLRVSDIYNKGYSRTGCFFCLFGIMRDTNRIVRLKQTHPKYYKFCMEKLGYPKVLKTLGVPYE